MNFKFHGQLQNSEVLDFYNNTQIDCFVTTSSTEGLPVSIMEALCYGIPVLATSVGGIPEAVDDKVGFLLNSEFSNKEFTLGLNKMHQFKRKEKRIEISLIGRKKYNASKNYNLFINHVLNKTE